MSTAIPAPAAPLRALAVALTASPDDAEAWIAVPAIHLELWRLLYVDDPTVSAGSIEALHAVLAAAYHLVGGYVSRHDGLGYYHEPTLAAAAHMSA